MADAGQSSILDASVDNSEPTPVPSTASLFLTIDNMEVRNDLPSIPSSVGGFWWSLGDFGGLGNWFVDSAGDNGALGLHGDALADRIVPPRGDSMAARHVQGSGRTSVDLDAQLRHPTNGSVDLSPYLGVSFWARLTSPSGQMIVALRGTAGAPLLTTELANVHFAQKVAVSQNWERYILLFDDFHQGIVSGNGSDEPFIADAVSNIDFVVIGLNGESFDLWIDDLALLCRGVCRVHSL